MYRRLPEETAATISTILSDYGLTPQRDIPDLLRERIDARENNLVTFCTSPSGEEYFFKFFLERLKLKQHSGVRAILNLGNEVRFYQQIEGEKLKNVIIPKLFAVSDAPYQYLITEKLNLSRVVFFGEDAFFTKISFPTFFIDSVISGIAEFQTLALEMGRFHHMEMWSINEWLGWITGSYSGKLTGMECKVRKVFGSH